MTVAAVSAHLILSAWRLVLIARVRHRASARESLGFLLREARVLISRGVFADSHCCDFFLAGAGVAVTDDVLP